MNKDKFKNIEELAKKNNGYWKQTSFSFRDKINSDKFGFLTKNQVTVVLLLILIGVIILDVFTIPAFIKTFF